MKTSTTRDARTPAAARGRPAAATRTGRRPRRCSRPAAPAGAGCAWISSTALPRSRPSRRPLTSAICRRFSRSSSRLAVCACHRRDRGHRQRLAVGGTNQRRWQLRRDRSGTHREAARAPGSSRSGRRRSVATSPSQLPASWFDTCSTVSPKRRGGDRIDRPTSPPGCPAARRRRRRRRRPCPASPRPARRARRGVPGRRRRSSPRSASALPSRSPSMSCSSCTNSISSQRRRLVQLSRRSVMTSSAVRLRSPRGLRRTRMSPVFCCGREQAQLRAGAPRVGRDLRGVGEDLLDALHLASVSRERAARRASGSR